MFNTTYQFITATDFLLLPLYIALILFIAIRIRNRYYPNGHPWRRFFLPGLIVKMLGAIGISLIYQYYYKVGDTILYFLQTKIVYESFWQEPIKALKIIFQIPKYYQYGYYDLTSRLIFYPLPSNFTVISVASIISLLCFGKYLIISLFLSAIAYSGIWALFRVFAKQYPELSDKLAISILFIPSVVIWGSGIFKDTICMFSLGWLTYALFNLAIYRTIKPYELLLGLAGCIFLYIIKIYILIALTPAIFLWIVFHSSKKFKLPLLRKLYALSMAVFIIVSFIYINTMYQDELGAYALQNITSTAKNTLAYIVSTSGDESSTYDLSLTDYTALSIIKAFPAAVNVALFRPYIWEARKVFVFLNAVEATFFLLATIFILIRLGPIKVWQSISSDPNLQFCLVFILLFAYSVGLTSGNFGALSRYRIPLLPFFSVLLMILYYKYGKVYNTK